MRSCVEPVPPYGGTDRRGKNANHELRSWYNGHVHNHIKQLLAARKLDAQELIGAMRVVASVG
jgi:hypothetical protein